MRTINFPFEICAFAASEFAACGCVHTSFHFSLIHLRVSRHREITLDLSSENSILRTTPSPHASESISVRVTKIIDTSF